MNKNTKSEFKLAARNLKSIILGFGGSIYIVDHISNRNFKEKIKTLKSTLETLSKSHDFIKEAAETETKNKEFNSTFIVNAHACASSLKNKILLELKKTSFSTMTDVLPLLKDYGRHSRVMTSNLDRLSKAKYYRSLNELTDKEILLILTHLVAGDSEDLISEKNSVKPFAVSEIKVKYQG